MTARTSKGIIAVSCVCLLTMFYAMNSPDKVRSLILIGSAPATSKFWKGDR